MKKYILSVVLIRTFSVRAACLSPGRHMTSKKLLTPLTTGVKVYPSDCSVNCRCAHITLTLEQLGHFSQNLISLSNVIQYRCKIFVWNQSNVIDIWSELLVLMTWCFSTKASVATALTTPCLSSYIWLRWSEVNHQILLTKCRTSWALLLGWSQNGNTCIPVIILPIQ